MPLWLEYELSKNAGRLFAGYVNNTIRLIRKRNVPLNDQDGQLCLYNFVVFCMFFYEYKKEHTDLPLTL